MSDVKAIPDDYPRVSAYLCASGASRAIEFYVAVLGVTERMRMVGPDGKVGHAELELGDSLIMIADEHPEMGAVGPKTVGGCPLTMSVYVEDVDAVFAKALELGGREVRPIENKFYGDRSGVFEDPFGYRWNVTTHVEDVSPEEMERRSRELFGAP